METHDNELVRKRLADIDQKIIEVDKSSLLDFQRQYDDLVAFEDKLNQSATKHRGASN